MLRSRSLGWQDDPGLSEWANSNHRGPNKREAGWSEPQKGNVKTEQR